LRNWEKKRRNTANMGGRKKQKSSAVSLEEGHELTSSGERNPGTERRRGTQKAARPVEKLGEEGRPPAGR